MVTNKQRRITGRIEEILRKRGSSLAEQVAQVSSVLDLDRDIREKIVDELGDEFCEKGLKPNSEPKNYGLEVEDLIDGCGLAHEKNKE